MLASTRARTADVARLSIASRPGEGMAIDTREVHLDGVPVWRLTWTPGDRMISGSAEWLGAFALSHAFIPPTGAGF